MPESFRHYDEDKFSRAETCFGISLDKHSFAVEEGMFFVKPRIRVRQGKVFSVQVRFKAEDTRAQLDKIISKTSGVAFFGGERGRVKISFRKNGWRLNKK